MNRMKTYEKAIFRSLSRERDDRGIPCGRERATAGKQNEA
jgi:hypothetical protein